MNRNTTLSLFAATLLFPPAAFALVIEAGDTVAGLGTEVLILDAAPDAAIEIVVVPPLGPEIVFPARTDETGGASIWVNGDDAETAGTYDVAVEKNGEVLATETAFVVLPDALDIASSSVQSRETTIPADGRSGAAVHVSLRDAYGNPLGGRQVQLISSRASDRIESRQKKSDGNGGVAFTVTANEPGPLTVRAVDLISGNVLAEEVKILAGESPIGGPQDFYGPGARANAQAKYAPAPMYYQPYPVYAPPMYQPYPTYPGGNVTLPVPRSSAELAKQSGVGSPYAASLLGKQFYGQVSQLTNPVNRFVIEVTNRVDPQRMKAADDYASISITATDSAGNRVEDYLGTALLSSTDSEAILPVEGIVTFEPGNLGKKQLTLGLAFSTPGEQWLRAVDSENPSVEGLMQFTVVGTLKLSAERMITIAEPSDGALLNAAEITVKGNGPPFINLTVIGGRSEVSGETDRDGFFSLRVTLDPSKTGHVLKVQDETGKYESEEVTLTIDVTPPEAESIAFTPEEIEEGKDILLVVTSEPGLRVSTMTLEETAYPLAISGSDPKKYQVLFQAPATGIHEPIITLEDALGNETTVAATLTVSPKGLPRVQNVIATPKANAVELTWDAITVPEIAEYRIYVGTSQTEFIYTLDTDRPTLSATVAGLRPAVPYYFAVTALLDERESKEKSEIIRASALGIRLDVTPQDGALLLQWTLADDAIPLTSFILSYGIGKDDYTEKRTLNGGLKAFTLRDLLNDQPYFLKLTPVATTGDVLGEFAAVGEGTPKASRAGFHATAADPIPAEFDGHAAAPLLPAPRTPEPPALSDEGIPLPAWWIAAAATCGIIGLHMIRRRRMRALALFSRRMKALYNS